MEQIPRTGRAMTNAAMLMLLAGSGCSDPPDMRDQRLVELARESMDRPFPLAATSQEGRSDQELRADRDELRAV